ncbi:MAG: PaaI family thioesterase [Candidatus Thiodiazotropha sp. 6PLUC6]
MSEAPQGSSVTNRLELFPPFKSMGVELLEITDDWSLVRLLLPLNRHNMNPGGSMFGGSIAALADPVAALACHNRFPDFTVWTRTLNVDFRKPGMSDLELRFNFPEKTAADVVYQLQKRGRATPAFEFGIYDASNDLAAWVDNTVAIRPGNESSNKMV